jgi:hypothetical protein
MTLGAGRDAASWCILSPRLWSWFAGPGCSTSVIRIPLAGSSTSDPSRSLLSAVRVEVFELVKGEHRLHSVAN